MNRHFFVTSSICVVAMLFAALAVAQSTQPTSQKTSGDKDFDERLAELDARSGQYADLVADFSQEKQSALLVDPIRTSGTIHAKASIVLWRSGNPTIATRVSRDRLQIYYAEQKTIEDFPIAGKLGQLAASPLPRLATLRERFDIVDDDGAGLNAAAGRLVLKLVPKDDEVTQYIGHLRVVLDVERALVETFELTDPDGEATTIRFSNVETNTNFPDRELELNAPAGTKVVKPLGS